MSNIIISKEKIDKKLKGVQVEGCIYRRPRCVEVVFTGFINDEIYKFLNTSFDDADPTLYVVDLKERVQMKMFVTKIKSHNNYFMARLALMETLETINI